MINHITVALRAMRLPKEAYGLLRAPNHTMMLLLPFLREKFQTPKNNGGLQLVKNWGALVGNRCSMPVLIGSNNNSRCMTALSLGRILWMRPPKCSLPLGLVNPHGGRLVQPLADMGLPAIRALQTACAALASCRIAQACRTSILTSASVIVTAFTMFSPQVVCGMIQS